MKIVRYFDMVGRFLRRVGCMKCNTFLYDRMDKPSVTEAHAKGLPVRIPILLSDGSCTNVLLCKGCQYTEVDLPQYEATAKFAWMYEHIKVGRNKDEIVRLGKHLKDLHFVRKY